MKTPAQNRETIEAASAPGPRPSPAVAGHRRALVANVRGSYPSGRYDVDFDGEQLVTGSRNPECDLARALLARGIVGKVKLLVDGKEQMMIDVEKLARLTVEESQTRGPHFVKWRPGTFVEWPTRGEAA